LGRGSLQFAKQLRIRHTRTSPEEGEKAEEYKSLLRLPGTRRWGSESRIWKMRMTGWVCYVDNKRRSTGSGSPFTWMTRETFAQIQVTSSPFTLFSHPFHQKLINQPRLREHRQRMGTRRNTINWLCVALYRWNGK
jgi:hypothetical protein